MFNCYLIVVFAELEFVVLIVLGIGLIVAEFFLTSGILGILGAGTILGSLYVAGYDFKIMTYSIAIALIVALVVAVILFRLICLHRGTFRRLVFKEGTTR